VSKLTDKAVEHDLNGSLFVEERRKQMLEILQTQNRIVVRDLGQRFGVSEATIRLDLKVLESQGFLTRTYGGAIRRGRTGYDSAYDERKRIRRDQKVAIAREASRMIETNDTVFIDSGTTCQELASQLAQSDGMTVLVNDLHSACILQANPKIRLIVVGGVVAWNMGPLVGPVAIDTINKFTVDKCFIGVTGLAVDDGLTATDVFEAETKRAILAKARERVVLADSTKIGRSSFARICLLDEIDVLVTDSEPPQSFLKAAEGCGLRVIIAGRGDPADNSDRGEQYCPVE
jgi:DeoR family fructose operon transcriptional repressor